MYGRLFLGLGGKEDILLLVLLDGLLFSFSSFFLLPLFFVILLLLFPFFQDVDQICWLERRMHIRAEK